MIIRTANGSLQNICLSTYNSNYELYSLILLLKFNIKLKNHNNNNYNLIINNIS